jgi:hypothetical protein
VTTEVVVETVLEPEIVEPDVTQGTVTVAIIVIVVAGAVYPGAVGVAVEAGARVEAVKEVMGTSVVGVYAGVSAGVTAGTVSVTVPGQLVMIPGFCGTNGAQIPARYERAAWTAAASAPQEETHSITLLVKSAFLQ